MLRPDYEVFCHYCMKHERELYPFKLINRQSEKKYPYNIARFNDLRYKAVYENVQEYDSGMFIDVYPLDGAGHMTESEVRSLDKKRDYLMKMILWSTAPPSPSFTSRVLGPAPLPAPVPA